MSSTTVSQQSVSQRPDSQQPVVTANGRPRLFGLQTPQFAVLTGQFRQFWPIWIFAVSAVLIVQLSVAGSLYSAPNSADNRNLHASLHQAPLLGALAFALGVVCLICGLDRESRSWHWRSSLPIAWQQDLKIQFGFLTFGTITCLLLTLISGWLIDHFMIAQSIDEVQSVWIWNHYIGGVFVSFPTLGILAVSLLLSENIGIGIAAGTVAAFLLQGLCLLLGEIAGVNYRTTDSIISLSSAWWFASNLIIAGIATVAFIRTYHWRWTTGQFSTFSPSRSFVQTRLVALHKTASLARTQRRLTFISIRYFLAALLLLLAFKTVLIIYFPSTYKDYLVKDPWTCILCGLIGLELFGTDCRQDNFRFFSDRGVSPAAIWSARIRTGFFSMLSILLLTTFVQFLAPITSLLRQDLWQLSEALLWQLSFYSLFAITRLCFRSWLISLMVGGIWTILLAEIMNLQKFAGGFAGQAVQTGVLLILGLWFSYSIWQRLFQNHQPQTKRSFVVFTSAYLLLNLAAFPLLRIYSVPSVDIEIAELKTRANNGVRDLLPMLISSATFEPGPITEAFSVATAADDLEGLRLLSRRIDTDEIVDHPLNRLGRLTKRETPLPADRLAEVRNFTKELTPIFLQLEEKYREENRVKEGQSEQLPLGLGNWLAQYFVVAASAHEDELALRANRLLHNYLSTNQYRLMIWNPNKEFPLTILKYLPDDDYLRLMHQSSYLELMPPKPSTEQLKNISAMVHFAIMEQYIAKPNEAMQIPELSFIPAKFTDAREYEVYRPSGLFTGLAQTTQTYTGAYDRWLPWERARKRRRILLSYRTDSRWIAYWARETDFKNWVHCDENEERLIGAAEENGTAWQRYWNQLDQKLSILEGHSQTSKSETKQSGDANQITAGKKDQ